MERRSSRAMVLVILIASANVGKAESPPLRTFDSKGAKIRYFVEGKGEPVVLIHGLYSSAKTNWDLPGTTGMLAKDYQVISLDLRGHGGSDKPLDDNAYGVEQRRIASRYRILLIPRRYFMRVLAAPGATLDGIHLSETGRRRMAQMVWEMVGSSLGVTSPR